MGYTKRTRLQFAFTSRLFRASWEMSKSWQEVSPWNHMAWGSEHKTGENCEKFGRWKSVWKYRAVCQTLPARGGPGARILSPQIKSGSSSGSPWALEKGPFVQRRSAHVLGQRLGRRTRVGPARPARRCFWFLPALTSWMMKWTPRASARGKLLFGTMLVYFFGGFLIMKDLIPGPEKPTPPAAQSRPQSQESQVHPSAWGRPWQRGPGVGGGERGPLNNRSPFFAKLSDVNSFRTWYNWSLRLIGC